MQVTHCAPARSDPHTHRYFCIFLFLKIVPRCFISSQHTSDHTFHLRLKKMLMYAEPPWCAPGGLALRVLCIARAPAVVGPNVRALALRDMNYAAACTLTLNRS